MNSTFVGEPLRPVLDERTAGPPRAGEPALPGAFLWRGRRHAVAETLETWKGYGPCASGGGERYLRRHWYRIRTTGGWELTVYFERRPRPGAARAAARWWLFSAVEPPSS